MKTEEFKALKQSKFMACTTPDCANYFQVDQRPTVYNAGLQITCNACKLSFCSNSLSEEKKCSRESGHSPLSCSDLTRWETYEPPEDRTRVIRDDANAEFIRANTRNCPKCNSKIWRTEGCNHMTCTCGANFCWRCRHVYVRNHEHHDCSLNNANEGEGVTEHVVSDQRSVKSRERHKKYKDIINDDENAVMLREFCYYGWAIDLPEEKKPEYVKTWINHLTDGDDGDAFKERFAPIENIMREKWKDDGFPYQMLRNNR